MSAAAVLALVAAALPAARFVPIPAGVFGGASVAAFSMQETEVTVAQFAAFVKATGYRTSAEKAGAERTWRLPGFAVSPQQPVVYVSVADAEAYCSSIGARLPTDAEWEYAARAGATTRHFWGERIDGRYLWYRANAEDRPHEVRRKRPNRWGLHDVEGNVWEWSLSTTPTGGERLASRRGGSWVSCDEIVGGPGKANSPLIGLAISYGIPVRFEHRYDDIGFRCARPAR